MFGGDEWLIIAIVALVLFGGSQLPKLAKNLGEAQRELKKAMRDEPSPEAAPEAPAPAAPAAIEAAAPPATAAEAADAPQQPAPPAD